MLGREPPKGRLYHPWNTVALPELAVVLKGLHLHSHLLHARNEMLLSDDTQGVRLDVFAMTFHRFQQAGDPLAVQSRTRDKGTQVVTSQTAFVENFLLFGSTAQTAK